MLEESLHLIGMRRGAAVTNDSANVLGDISGSLSHIEAINHKQATTGHHPPASQDISRYNSLQETLIGCALGIGVCFEGRAALERRPQLQITASFRFSLRELDLLNRSDYPVR